MANRKLKTEPEDNGGTPGAAEAAGWIAEAAGPHRAKADRARRHAEDFRASAAQMKRARALAFAKNEQAPHTLMDILAAEDAAENFDCEAERETAIADAIDAAGRDPALAAALAATLADLDRLADVVAQIDASLRQHAPMLAVFQALNEAIYSHVQDSDVSGGFERSTASLESLLAHRSGAKLLETWRLPDRGEDPERHIDMLGGNTLGWSREHVIKGVAVAAIRAAKREAEEAFDASMSPEAVQEEQTNG